MVKAVLVMDMPELVCQKCALCYETLAAHICLKDKEREKNERRT